MSPDPSGELYRERDIGSTENDNPLASRENGRVDFTKIEGTISRTQPLPDGFTAKFAATGQYAFTSLLASEECGYGGRDFGHAYDSSAITGDSCWVAIASLERATQSDPALRFMDHVFQFARHDLV